jgi:hypothetical protein
MVGAISADTGNNISATLYGRIPMLGRVKIASLSGALVTDGKATTVSVNVDVAVAKGSVSLTLDSKILYITFHLEVKLLGTLTEQKYKLLTIP